MRNIPDVVVGFDEYARAHLFSNVSRNSSALYAGFEAITDADAVAEVVGVDITELGGRDYRLNQLFTSNFANGTASGSRDLKLEPDRQPWIHSLV